MALCIDPEQLPGQGRILLGFSGGPDSVCLAALLARTQSRRPILCVHVDHNLDPGSGQRAEQALAIARRLGLPAQGIQVQTDGRASGLEAGARKARYQALAAMMDSNELLLTAHHAGDQAETILMRLLRGSGPAGLAGIPTQRRFGPGWLARPLLTVERERILAWLTARGLDWVEDPTNLDTQLDRNFLRLQVLPMLRQRWPAVETSIRRSGQLNRGAADALAKLSHNDLDQLLNNDGSLAAHHLLRLSPYRQGEVIRLWCHRKGIEAPPGRQLECFIEQLRDHRPGSQPELLWRGHWLVCQRHALWLFACKPDVPDSILSWSGQTPLTLPGGLGHLELLGCPGLAKRLTVRFGQSPGERIALPGRKHHHAVKQLMNEAAIPPWQRPLWPRLLDGDHLLAVGQRWLDRDFSAWLTRHGGQLHWHSPLASPSKQVE